MKLNKIFLSTVSIPFIIGYFEFGCINFLFDKIKITHIIIMLFLFQFGFLVSGFTKGKSFWIKINLCLAIIFTLMTMKFSHYYMYILSPFLGFEVGFLKETYNGGSKYLKLFFRLLGIGLSFLYNIYFILIFAIYFFINICLTTKKIQYDLIDLKKIDFLMIAHQIHYYVYIYIITFSFCLINKIYSSMLVMLSWVTYFIPIIFITKIRRMDKKKYFIISQVALFVLFTSIFLLYNKYIAIILWILTGFFSGSITCYKDLLKFDNNYVKSNFDLSENVGHVIGTLLSLLFSILLPINYAFIVSAVSCLIVFIMAKHRFSRG